MIPLILGEGSGIGLSGVLSLRVDVEGNHVCLSNDDDGITE